MSAPPDVDRIVAELEAGVAAMDAEIKAVHDRRVEIVGATDDMRRRTEALARSRFVIAEQLAQLKESLAAQTTDVIPCAAQHADGHGASQTRDPFREILVAARSRASACRVAPPNGIEASRATAQIIETLCSVIEHGMAPVSALQHSVPQRARDDTAEIEPEVVA